MTDDQLWRTILTGGAVALVGVFREPIARWLRKIWYTGWK